MGSSKYGELGCSVTPGEKSILFGFNTKVVGAQKAGLKSYQNVYSELFAPEGDSTIQAFWSDPQLPKARNLGIDPELYTKSTHVI